MFAPKRGGAPAIFMYYWMNSENIHVHDCSYGLTYVSKYSCLTGTLSTKKIYIYTVVEVGDGMGQGPATEVTY